MSYHHDGDLASIRKGWGTFFGGYCKSRNKRSGTRAGPIRALIGVYTNIATKRPRGSLIMSER